MSNNIKNLHSIKRKYVTIGFVIIIPLLVAILIFSILNAKKSMDHFDCCVETAGIIVTVILFFVGYKIHDYVDMEEKIKNEYLAAVYICKIMSNAYYTIDDPHFINEMVKLKNKDVLALEDNHTLQFFQNWPFAHYEKMVESYIRKGLLPPGLINAYCVSKKVFARYVYLFCTDSGCNELNNLKMDLYICHNDTILKLMDTYKNVVVDEEIKLTRIKNDECK